MANYINVLEVLQNPSALTQAQGDMIYPLIFESLKGGEKITVDFEDIESIISPFLNNAIGKLYKDYNSDTISKLLIVKNYPEEKISTLNLVIENSKKFYADQEKFEAAVKGVIN